MLSAAAAGCGGTAPQTPAARAARPDTAGVAPVPLTLDERPRGTVHFLVGPCDWSRGCDGDLYRWRPDVSRPVRLTDWRRGARQPLHLRDLRHASADFIGASGGELIGSFASTAGSDLHQILVVDGKPRFRLLARAAHMPAIGPGGRIAFVGYADPRGGPEAALVGRLGSPRFRPLLRTEVQSVGWAGNGDLVILQRRRHRSKVSIFRGSRRLRLIHVRHHVNHIWVTQSGVIGLVYGDWLEIIDGPRRRRVNVRGWGVAGPVDRLPGFVLSEVNGTRVAAVDLRGRRHLIGRTAPGSRLVQIVGL